MLATFSRAPTLQDPALFFDAFAFFLDFFAVLTPTWCHFDSILDPLGFILARFGKFWALCWHYFGATLGPLEQELALDALVWWGYAKQRNTIF